MKENYLLKVIEKHKSAKALERFVFDIWLFFIHNAQSCLFALLMFSLLAFTQVVHLPFLPRYDWILVFVLIIQALMLIFKWESRDEFKVILLFHALGLCMELFKVWKGSWTYPEEGYSKIAGVPLYSGFMYACVASYMCQAWRRFDLQLTGPVPHRWALVVAIGIYLNFFTLHYIIDLRIPLAVLAILIYRQVDVRFTLFTATYQMPMLLAFLLIGFFIWLAENIATFLGAWQYAYQHQNWQMVNSQKLGSWILMVIVSFMVVAELKHFKKIKQPSKQKNDLK